MKTYTTVQAAQKLGVSRNTIYRWIRGRKIKAAGFVRTNGVELRIRLWTEKDLRDIRKFMRRSYVPRARRKKG